MKAMRNRSDNHRNLLAVAIVLLSVPLSRCSSDSSAPVQSAGGSGTGGASARPGNIGGAYGGAAGNTAFTSMGGLAAGGSAGGVTLGTALQDPDVAAAAQAVTSQCQSTAQRVGQCSGFSVGSSQCLVENWPATLIIASVQAAKDCLAARSAEYSCAQSLDCTSFVDWYNHEAPGTCAAESTAVSTACPAQLRS